jgi:hypothetical protein
MATGIQGGLGRFTKGASRCASLLSTRLPISASIRSIKRYLPSLLSYILNELCCMVCWHPLASLAVGRDRYSVLLDPSVLPLHRLSEVRTLAVCRDLACRDGSSRIDPHTDKPS